MKNFLGHRLNTDETQMENRVCVQSVFHLWLISLSPALL